MVFSADLKALSKLKDSGLSLLPHQVDGVKKILSWFENGHGGILADEMGLGKTCQVVCSMVLLVNKLKNPKFVVICPLSVIEHWENEIMRFGCGQLKLFIYKGSKITRDELEKDLKSKQWNICLTTYTPFRLDNERFDFPIDVFVIDEAHAVKNQVSLLHQTVCERNAKFHLLLTGTPIQNDLDEFYSLLSLADPEKYPEDEKEQFLMEKKDKLVEKLKDATEKYVFRRLKTEVCKNLPSIQEVVLHHGLTKFQRDLYNAILVSNREFFKATKAPRQSLLSLLVQLRKAVSHPYLFQGVEPEPFTEGEHLFTASGKFMVLDKLLQFLKRNGHRCLIFSQYARTLQILADALTFRGYIYEHFDGSTKAEERFKS
uniref:Helicase ATP-binding domain-containing protein n=1 Tax=Panagrolaimus sp. JU765 TaxID=591449 RepID=A0AC34Q477_9BILA